MLLCQDLRSPSLSFCYSLAHFFPHALALNKVKLILCLELFQQPHETEGWRPLLLVLGAAGCCYKLDDTTSLFAFSP